MNRDAGTRGKIRVLFVFNNNIESKKKLSMFTHCRQSLLGAGPLVSGFDRQPVTCRRIIQAGSELGWRVEVQRGLSSRRIRRVGRKKRM